MNNIHCKVLHRLKIKKKYPENRVGEREQKEKKRGLSPFFYARRGKNADL